ncbi:polysaccharide deacetylase family protein [Noviherbaspirillum massiliense]|uniref:polysaccharide deacetylase family protein n=1 Tax=Noviherbaspirillum massiliense TaxID=1465823 RepID=UPI0003696A2F|nr:polysaccharide deacetylase family protein [Noviherbaspirillum massiliense]
MMFTVIFPEGCRQERNWISSVLLHEFLGIEHEVRFNRQSSVRLCADGKVLELPDIFFKYASSGWLTPETLPVQPLQWWFVPASNEFNPKLTAPFVPVIFGQPGFRAIDDTSAWLGLDIFGSGFFMLSRYEEAVRKERDLHDRFPAAASLAFQEGFLDRPVVDEYTEILWSAMLRLWPQLKRRARQFKVLVSCDVDYPCHPAAYSFHRMLRSTASKALHEHNPLRMLSPIRNYMANRFGDWRSDSYYLAVDWIMDVNEKAGNKVAFNFIPQITDPIFDDTSPITSAAVAEMMKKIDVRGHEIGLHPGYRSYQSIETTLSGLGRLCEVLRGAGIRQQICGGRNHYLRWSTKTPSVWDATGLRYDSTLSYADHVGFRCGTCTEFTMYDLDGRRPLQIKQKPLICMECTVSAYMGYGFTDAALEKMNKLKNAAREMKGSFSLLWHNSNLESASAKALYCEVIK